MMHYVESVLILIWFWFDFWYVFSCIRTEYVVILRISPYSVRKWENMNQKNSKYTHFLRVIPYKNEAVAHFSPMMHSIQNPFICFIWNAN